jgi:NAD(P) transhydrogenase subunit alpha
MRIGIPKETSAGESRVALVPETVGRLKDIEVVVEPGAGEAAGFPDAAYTEAGATIGDPWGAEIVAKVAAPTAEQAARLRDGQVLIAFLQPLTDQEGIARLQSAGVVGFALESVPRITRAQSMDALSSQATVGGYKAALIAADRLPRFMPMLMTAAGTIPPAKVLVLGAGVAGLQAIATARRLGAVVSAYDVRAAAGEEVRSLGATFLELELATQEGAGGYARAQGEEFLARQRELIGSHVASSDAVITTALVPGRRAPLLVTTEMVQAMRQGSVVVDLAAETGGNVEPSQPGRTIEVGGARVWGGDNVPSGMPVHASTLYARNLLNLLTLMIERRDDGPVFAPDPSDEIVAGTRVTSGGRITHETVLAQLAAAEGTT